jgi:virginiamycin A acetyltransferase
LIAATCLGVAPYTVVDGSPARVLRTRYPQEIIDEMRRIAWWD